MNYKIIALKKKYKKKILSRFTVGDIVRAVIISIEAGSNLPVVFLSMKNSKVESNSLGPSKVPINNKYYNQVLNYFEKRSFNSVLVSNENFTNPYALGMMIKYFKIKENESLINDSVWKATDYWDKIRDSQNHSWAQETVALGVMYAKKEDYENSIKCYTQALEVDSNHKDALVARGAAYANQEKYELAIKDFDDALKIDPNDKNAKSYLSATRDQFEKISQNNTINTITYINSN